MAALALLVLLGVALAAGCASTPSGLATRTPTPASTTASADAVATTAASSGSSGSGALPAVGYGRLIPFIPRTAGAWTLDDDPMGMTGKDPEGKKHSLITGIYSKTGDKTVPVNIQIHDLATAESPM